MTRQMLAEVRGRCGGIRVNALPWYRHRNLVISYAISESRPAYIEKWPKPWNKGKALNPVFGNEVAILAMSP